MIYDQWFNISFHSKSFLIRDIKKQMFNTQQHHLENYYIGKQLSEKVKFFSILFSDFVDRIFHID